MTAPSGVPYKQPPKDKIGGSANLGATLSPSAANAATPTPFAVAGNNPAGYAGVSQEYRNYSDVREQPLPAVQTVFAGVTDPETGSPRGFSAEELVDNDLPAQSEEQVSEVAKVVKKRASEKRSEASGAAAKAKNDKRAKELDEREADLDAREQALQDSAKAESGDSTGAVTAPVMPSAGSKTTTGAKSDQEKSDETEGKGK